VATFGPSSSLFQYGQDTFGLTTARSVAVASENGVLPLIRGCNESLVLGFHTPGFDDSQSSSLRLRHCIIVMNPELKPDDVDIIAFERRVDDAGYFGTGPEYVHDLDFFFDLGQRVVRWPAEHSASLD
jgi:hypothetical protein